VKLLRTQKVVYISCGEEHTAVLTKVRRLGGWAVDGGEMGNFICRRVANCGGRLLLLDLNFLFSFVVIVLGGVE
jgi:hypothetical protein